MVFPVVLYGCERWTIKKADQWRIDAFKLWCWRRLLSIPWTARRSNQSILKESALNIHWKDWCWRWSSNTLATWYEELIYWRRLWCWERLKAGKGDDRGWDNWMASPTQWTCVWASSRRWWRTGEPWCAAFHGVAKIWTRLNDYTTAITNTSCSTPKETLVLLKAEETTCFNNQWMSEHALFMRWGLVHCWQTASRCQVGKLESGSNYSWSGME